MVNRKMVAYTGMGIYLDGSTNYASFQNSSVDSATTLTFSMTFKIPSGAWQYDYFITHGYQKFWIKTDTSPSKKIKVMLYGSAGNTDTFLTNTEFSEATWYTLSFVVDGANVYIYINGELDTSGTLTDGSLNTTSGTIYWMAYPTASGGVYLNAYIDNYIIYNTALTSTQIKSLYNAEPPQSNRIVDFSNGFYDATDTSTSMTWYGTDTYRQKYYIYTITSSMINRCEVKQNIKKHITTAAIKTSASYKKYFSVGDYILIKRNYMDGVSSTYEAILRGKIKEVKQKGGTLEITAYDRTEELKSTVIYEPLYGMTITEALEYVISSAGLAYDVTTSSEKIQLYITNGKTAYDIIDDITSSFGWFFYHDAETNKIVCRKIGYTTNSNTLSTGTSGVIKGLPEWKHDLSQMVTKATITPQTNYTDTQYQGKSGNVQTINDTSTTMTQLIYLSSSDTTLKDVHITGVIYGTPTLSFTLGWYDRDQYTGVDVLNQLSSGTHFYDENVSHDERWVFPTPDTSTTLAINEYTGTANLNYDTNGTVRTKFRQLFSPSKTNSILYTLTVYFNNSLTTTLTTSDYFNITLKTSSGETMGSTTVYVNGVDNHLVATFPDGIYLDGDFYVEVEYSGSTIISTENWMTTHVSNAGEDIMEYWDASASTWVDINELDTDVRTMTIVDVYVAQPALVSRIVAKHSYDIQLPKLASELTTTSTSANSQLTLYVSRNARHYFLAPTPTYIDPPTNLYKGYTQSSFVIFDDEDESDTGTADYILTSATEDTTHTTAYTMVKLDRDSVDPFKCPAIYTLNIYQEFPTSISGSPSQTTYTTTQQLSADGEYVTDITISVNTTIETDRWYAIEISCTSADTTNYVDIYYGTSSNDFGYGKLYINYSGTSTDIKFLLGYGTTRVPSISYENTKATDKYGKKEKNLNILSIINETDMTAIAQAYVDYYSDINNLRTATLKLRDHETFGLAIGQEVTVKDEVNNIEDTFIVMEYVHVYPYNADRVIIGGDISQFTALIKSIASG